MSDQIAEAVSATEPTKVEMATIQVTLSSGRPVAVVVPADLTTREALDVVSFVSSGLGAELVRRRTPKGPRLVKALALPRSPRHA